MMACESCEAVVPDVETETCEACERTLCAKCTEYDEGWFGNRSVVHCARDCGPCERCQAERERDR
jgi:hypothetical protein